MERFVCIRIVQGWGLDLSLFQFDWRATWTVFLMNADRAIYGRYDARQADDLIGLRKALEGALELHAQYPANKAELAGKIGPAPRWKTPEEIPTIEAKGKYRRAVGREGCVHCHNILEGTTKSLKARGEPIPESLAAPYPTPQRVGIMLSSKERATVTDVDRHSPAEKAGIKEGDRILRFGGQPVISWADVQWVLFTARDSEPLTIEAERDGKRIEMKLELPPGWRTR